MTPVVPYRIRKSEDGVRGELLLRLKNERVGYMSSCLWNRPGYWLWKCAVSAPTIAPITIWPLSSPKPSAAS